MTVTYNYTHNPGYERTTNEAVRFTDEAARNHFTFAEVLCMVREAWIVTHENQLSQAKWQVEQSIKRPEVK